MAHVDLTTDQISVSGQGSFTVPTEMRKLAVMILTQPFECQVEMVENLCQTANEEFGPFTAEQWFEKLLRSV